MAAEYIPKIRSFNPDTDDLRKGRGVTTYHYTSPAGAKAILGSHSIRFTDCQFLNDKSEYVHIRKPLFQALDEIRDDLSSTEIPQIIERLFNDNYESELTVIMPLSDINPEINLRFIKQRYYVFCTPMKKDALNMWNYYVKDGNYLGYNLGLSINSIIKGFSSLKNEDVELLYGKVLYKESEQVDYLKKGLLDIKLRSRPDDGAETQTLSFLEGARLFFKDEAFTGEDEFRFVIKLPLDYAKKDSATLNVGYDLKGGVIVPHCSLNIEKKSLRSVALSPMLDKVLAEQGLRRFLTDCGYEDKLEIIQSSIPIRY